MVDNRLEILELSESGIPFIRSFLKRAGSSLESFRYFDKRPFTVINNHIVTVVLLQDEIPIGYGHLDKENNTIWLGIAIIENERGNGYGKQIMSYLFRKAKQKGISKISLSVDKDNKVAIRLYEKFGFEAVSDLNGKTIMENKIGQ